MQTSFQSQGWIALQTSFPTTAFLTFAANEPPAVIYCERGKPFLYTIHHKDVQWSFSLYDSIAELQRFDDEKLFPYLKALIAELERVIEPSPMVV